MRNRKTSPALLLLLVTGMVLQSAPMDVKAGQQDAIRSCYEIAKVGKSPATVDTSLIVMIDQTTLLDDGLKQAASNQIRTLVQPGVAFSVVRFAAFTQSYYTEVMVSGRTDPVLDENSRGDISKPLLAKFDNCMKYQIPFANKLVQDALQKSFAGSSNSIEKSDVLASLKDVSTIVRNTNAKRKIVFVVSDMLENSSITSFYSNQSVRHIDPTSELKKVEEAKLLGDFEGAKIYVMGAGLLADKGRSSKAVYRDPKTMNSLGDFWREYFKRSHSELVEFGQPALLSPIH